MGGLLALIGCFCRGEMHEAHLCGLSIPLRKPVIGKLGAGEPHARFGGRGGNTSRPLFLKRREP